MEKSKKGAFEYLLISGKDMQTDCCYNPSAESNLIRLLYEKLQVGTTLATPVEFLRKQVHFFVSIYSFDSHESLIYANLHIVREVLTVRHCCDSFPFTQNCYNLI